MTGSPLIGDAPFVAAGGFDNRRMAQAVCCPNCWTWSDVGARTTCKRCGTALVLPDGRALDEARNAPPPPPPPPGGFAYAGGPQAVHGYGGPAFVTAPAGRDWVAICRWFTIGYGLLTAMALIGIGLLVRHISLPITDPNTGVTTVQTFDIGAAFAFLALLVGAVTALLAWLTRYTAARVIFLLLDALGLISLFTGAGTTVRAAGYGSISLVSVAIDIAYGLALVMSLMSRPQPAYV